MQHVPCSPQHLRPAQPQTHPRVHTRVWHKHAGRWLEGHNTTQAAGQPLKPQCRGRQVACLLAGGRERCASGGLLLLLCCCWRNCAGARGPEGARGCSCSMHTALRGKQQTASHFQPRALTQYTRREQGYSSFAFCGAGRGQAVRAKGVFRFVSFCFVSRDWGTRVIN